MTSVAPSEQTFPEKSVIVLRDQNGFGLRLKGQSPVLVEHVHEKGAAWRAGIRAGDRLSRVNGVKVNKASHKDVVLMFKGCARFVGLTIQVEQPKSEPAGAAGKALASVVELPVALPELQHQIPLARQLVLSRLHHMPCSLSHHSFSAADSLLLRPSVDGMTRKPPSAGHSPLTTTVTSEDTSTGNQTPASEICGPVTALACPLQARRSESVTHRQSHKLVLGDTPSSASQSAGKTRIPAAELLRQRILGGRIRDLSKQQNIGFMMSRRQAGGQKLSNDELTKSTDSRQSGTRYLRLRHSASSSSLRPQNQRQESANNDSDQKNVPIIVVPAATPRPPTNKRLEIIREFIDTEKTHTDRLKCLDELFYKPLKAGGLMSDEQLRSVFSCHKTLYHIHRQIYRILLSATHNLYSEPMIGSALLEIFEGNLRRKLERAACSFCSAQSTNAELLNKLTRRDTNVGEFIAQVARQQTADRLGIKDLLASCFQRLTKYPLLLDNLLKATPKTLAEFMAQSGSRLNLPTGRASSDKNCRRKLTQSRSPKRRSNDDDDEYDDEDEDMNNDGQQLDDLDGDGQVSNDSDLEEQVRQSQRMLAISLAEEREFIERALNQSRQILFKVDDYVKVAISHNKLNEIWRKTEKYPGVSSVDISKQHVIHDGSLTLRLSRRSFDVYVLLLNDYIVILTREGQDKYKLKSFYPEGKSSASSAAAALVANSGDRQQLQQQSVFSPIFVIDEHLTTRDAATDENGFYLLCKRKDDSRIYEFASRSPAERLVWRDRIQWAVERQMSRSQRRSSCESTITKSSSELSAKQDNESLQVGKSPLTNTNSAPPSNSNSTETRVSSQSDGRQADCDQDAGETSAKKTPTEANSESGDRIAGTISYVEDDGLVMPSKMGSSRPFVDQAVQVSVASQNCT